MNGAEGGQRTHRPRDTKKVVQAILGVCPNCGEGKIFRGVWKVNETCSVCGVRFERDSGAWLGALVIAYAAGILAVLVVAAITIVLWGLYPGLEWVLVATGTLSIVLLYRPIKGFWIWSMWAAGIVLRDDEAVDAGGPRESRGSAAKS